MTHKEKILDTLMDIRFASANTFYSRKATDPKGCLLRAGINLNNLCRDGYIKEVEFDDEPRNKRREQFYTITQKGAAFIDRDKDYKTLKYKAKRFIKHQSMISDVAMSFKCLYPNKFDFKYGTSKDTLKADIYITGGELIYLVEVERKDDAEIEAVKAECDEHQKLLIDFCRETGCRINEALRLKQSDIGENYLVLYTRKAKDSNLTPRKIPLPGCLKGRESKRERIFSYWTDNPKFLERKVRVLKQHLWGFHNLRHKYASELSCQGRPIFEIMSLLGHTTIATTQKYLQLLAAL